MILRKGFFRLFQDSKIRSAYLFISVPFLLIFIFRIIPVFVSLILSLCDYNMVTFPKYIGFSNYVRLFLEDDIFLKSLINTGYYTLFTVPLTIIFALIVAVILNQRWFQGKNVFRALYFTPVVTSMTAVSLVFSWIYDPSFGILNRALEVIGLPAQKWLADPKLAMPCIIAMSIWKGLGYDMVLYLSGFSSIPSSLYEAARIDGASPFQEFRYITWPLSKFVTFFLIIMGVIGSFQVFDQVYMMTGGGPVNATIVVIYFIWARAFRDLRMGYASSAAWVLFLILVIFTALQMNFSKSRGLVEY